MRKILGSLVYSALVIVLITKVSRASFEETGIGARATAMGGAFTAIADDVHAIYYNPAGLSQIQRKEFAASYGLEHTGLSDSSKIYNSYVTYAHPFQYKIGTFAMAWQQFTTENAYKERVLSIGYGKRFYRKLSLGTTVKQLYREFTIPTGSADNPGFIDTGKTDPIYASGNSKSNVGLDIGALWRLNEKYSLGLMLQDINEPDMGIASGNRDIAPMVLRSGLAYQDKRFTLAGQLNTVKSPGGQSRDTFVTLAGEKWVGSKFFTKGDLGIRGSLSAGPKSWSQVTMGLSYRIGPVQADYGFLMPIKGIGFGTSQGNHRITLSFRFGKIMPNSGGQEFSKDAHTMLAKAEQELDFYTQESTKITEELSSRKSSLERRIAEIQRRRMAEGNESSDKRLNELFVEEMNWYWEIKTKGAGVANRAMALSQITNVFSIYPIDMGILQKENDQVRVELAKVESQLTIEWESYLRFLSRQANPLERIQKLSAMIQQFAPTGIDPSRFKGEIEMFNESEHFQEVKKVLSLR